MSDQDEQYEKSWILHHILDMFIGSREVVATRRKAALMTEQVCNMNHTHRDNLLFYTGSKCEGIEMAGSDRDVMFIDEDAIVLCPLQDSCIPQDSRDKTVFMMRDAASRPGYVMLELVQLGPRASSTINQSIVPVRDKLFISSEIYRQYAADGYNIILKSNVDTHGPAACLKSVDHNIPVDCDIATSFVCHQWPRQAYEWVNRPRYHGWPEQALKDHIVEDGCHLVPVGDRTSADPFIQWRISFTTAERKLIHSLTHTQFLIYGLLKYFLKQISDRLKQIFGDEDIISSYIIKTVVFYAVESTPASLWQEKTTFFCFMFCLSILIAWVKAGYCPNYFISNNNMFKGKLQGENQIIQKHLCGNMISSLKLYIDTSFPNPERLARYKHLYCGRGYTLLYKIKEGCVSDVLFPNTALQLCPSQLLLELSELPPIGELIIPPLPYAVFLTFLCYHELGDTRRRDAALIQLRAVKYDKDQGVSYPWIVHNLSGRSVFDTISKSREKEDRTITNLPIQTYRSLLMKLGLCKNSIRVNT